MSLSATLFGRDSAIHRLTNIMGLGIPGWLDKKFGPPETEGPRLSDLSVQTSTYGADIPRLYGTISVMGNVIQLENNKLKETVRKKKSGGKGGGGASEPTKTYSYSATFQLALCEGPIAGIRRMWCGDKLIYNAGSDDLETIIASNQAAKGWKLYLGTDDQMPDSRYEAEYGVGNVSAHRGLAYIAFYDFKLADYSNTLQAAQFKVEVVDIVPTGSTLLYDYLIDSENSAENQVAGHSNISGTGLLSYYASFTSTSILRYADSSGRIEIADFNDFSELISSLGYNPAVFPSPIYSSDDIEAIFYGQSFPPLDRAPSLIIRTAGTEKLYYQPTYYEDRVFFERAGYLWQKWTDGGTYYIGRVDFDGPETPLGSTAYVVNPIVSFESQMLAPSAAGEVCVFNFFMGELASSTTVSVELIDASGETVKSGSFTLDRPQNSSSNVFSSKDSRGYIDDNGILNISVNQDYDTVSTIAGRLFLVRYDTISMSFVDSRELISPANVSENFFVSSISVKDGICFFGKRTENKIGIAAFAIDLVNSHPVPLASMIISEVEKTSLLTTSDINVALLSQVVRGYRVSGGTIRSALEPPQAAYQFDVRPRGYQIQFLPRGQASVATIPWEDLGATSGDTPDDIFQQSREMDTQLPAKTVVKYLDAAREYAINEQFSERLNTEAVNKVERDLALVLTADEAAGIAEVLNFLPWLERTPASFTLPPPYRYLEAGDVVTVVSQAATYEIRLTEANETQDGRLECQAVPNRAALYTPAATGSEGVPPVGTIGLAGESLLVPLDIPVIDEILQDTPGFIGVMTGYTNGWPGGLAVRSIDDGQTWADLQAYNGKATIGTTQDILPVSDCTLIDQRSLTVDLISGELDSVTRDQMLAGINYAAYGIDGRWEIVRFQNAVLQSGGEYFVSGFVRGEKGTEWATGLHAAGDYFVLLDDPDNAFIGMAVGSIAVPATYRGVTSGASVDDSTDVPFTYQGVNLECLSPAYPGGTRDGSDNFTGTFTRRSRLSSSWWATGVAAPVGEASEAYEIDVMNGSTVARTITASAPSFAYSAADQSTDFGSAQASITFRIYQLSAAVGRGLPLEVTL